MTHISDIKLIRTDTTLDLSQKAEKGMSVSVTHAIFIVLLVKVLFFWRQCGTNTAVTYHFFFTSDFVLLAEMSNAKLKVKPVLY